jgi:subtilisin family serine protease
MATGKAQPGGRSDEPVRVIVEIKVSRAEGALGAFDAGATAFSATRFQADESWEPVPIGAAADAAAAFETAGQETVLVRGTVEKGQMAALESQANVESVWLDTPIAAFSSLLPGEERDLVQAIDTAAFGPCPIPPCDCPPLTAKGDIPAVRSYLGIDQIHAAGVRGQGIVVGVVDGGLTTPARVTGGKIPGVIGGPKPDWGQRALWGGHGEMSATAVLGMAPSARLYDLRLPDSAVDPLGAQISDAIAGYQWAITRHQADGTPQVLTNSWGIYQKAWDPTYATNPNHPFTRKVVDALNEGILVLFAAGNCGEACPSGRCGTDNGPGKSIWGANGHAQVMTVGAANIRDEFVGYSSQGPAALSAQKPDFCGITHYKGYYAVDNGTSAACPIAAGVVALLKQAKPQLTQASAKDALKATAKNIGPAGWDASSGSGIIQAKAAYDKVKGVTTTPARCTRERQNAERCLALYRRTRQQRYLCCYYYWAAAYYRCRYLATRDRRYLCRYYAYQARYYLCLYRLTSNRRYRVLYERYLAAYRRCR